MIIKKTHINSQWSMMALFFSQFSQEMKKSLQWSNIAIEIRNYQNYSKFNVFSNLVQPKCSNYMDRSFSRNQKAFQVVKAW